jgi:AcrR family transcriptional regulator
MVTTATRQDRRRLRTRDALVSAAEQLFAARGPDAVSIDEIVARANIAKGSFYNHFDDKDALAKEISRAIRIEIEREVDAINKGIADAASRVARALCAFCRFASRNPERVRAMLHLHPSATDPKAPMNEGVRRDVMFGLAAGTFAATSRDAAILFVIGAVQASFHRAGVIGEAATRQLAPAMASHLLQGLGLLPDEAEAAASGAARAVFGSKRGMP